MSRRWNLHKGLVVLFTFAFSHFPVCVNSNAQDRVYGIFQKTVVDGVTGKPISGATVEFIEPKSGTSIVKHTNSQGVVYQRALPPGQYTLRISAPGYYFVEFLQYLRFTSSSVLDIITLFPEDVSTREKALPVALETSSSISTIRFPRMSLQTGHAWLVSSIAFSPDSKILASGSYDSSIKLWDVLTGTELRTLIGHRSVVEAVAFSPDGQLVASGSDDNTVRLWEISTGQEVRSWSVDFSRSLAFSPDGQMLACGSIDSGIKLLSIGGQGAVTTLLSKTSVESLAFDGSGGVLAAGTGEGEIELWNPKTREMLATLKGHRSLVTSISFGPDGNILASGGWDASIKLWDVRARNELKTITVDADIRSMSFSPNGKTIATTYRGKSGVGLWDATSGEEIQSISIDEALSVAFSPDGSYLASGAGSNKIVLWNIDAGLSMRPMVGRASKVTLVGFSPNGKYFASGSSDGQVTLWDPAAGAPYRTFSGLDARTLVFSPDSQQVASVSESGRIKVWNAATDAKVEIGEETPEKASCVVFGPNGRVLASCNSDKIYFWDPQTGKALFPPIANAGPVASIAFSADGKTLISGNHPLMIWQRSPEETIKRWDVVTGRELGSFAVRGPVSSLTLSRDGKMLASAVGGKVKLWDALGGKEIGSFDGGPIRDISLAFSPDGLMLAMGSSDKTIRLIDVRRGEILHTLIGHSSAITSVAFSPDGKLLASGSNDASTKLWEVRNGTEMLSLVSLGNDKWLAVTPSGLFDGSAVSWGQIFWRLSSNLKDIVPIENFFNEFYYPNLLTAVFDGRRPRAAQDVSQKDRRQPQLKLALADAKPDGTLAARNVALKIDLSEVGADKDHKTGSGAQDVRLFRNGSLVKVWRGDVLNGKETVTLEATVPIVAGENKFSAYAFNHDNIKSSDAELIVTGADSLKRQGTAYILAIGVNTYANEQYNLKYAVADAEDFATELKRQQETLKHYAKVEVISLADAEATKANITQKLSDLAKQVQPEDAVIVFFAGHGTAQGNQFYLIPHDLGYDGRRDNLNELGLQRILAHSVSDRELEKLFETIDAGQLLLVIDACNSGQALEAEEKRRGPMNSKGLAQLAYEKGMYVLTAAQSYQAAREAAKFGHGFLTYALVEEGLKQGAADREPRNGSIDIREWLNFATDEVPKMQEENSADALRGRGRYLVFVGDGREVGIPRTEAETRDNLQRPRVFYRRELDINPLVVGTAGAVPNH